MRPMIVACVALPVGCVRRWAGWRDDVFVRGGEVPGGGA